MAKTQEITPRALVLPDPSRQQVPEGTGGKAVFAALHEIGQRHPRSHKLLGIFSTLATGWLPWGVEWERRITRHGNEWILCCGHVLGFAEAQRLVSAGLLTPAVNLDDSKDSLILTPAGLEWLRRNWSPTRKPRATRTSVPHWPPEPFEEDPNPDPEMRAAVEGDLE